VWGSRDTYISDVNSLASLRPGSGIVCEGIWSSCRGCSIETTTGAASISAPKATTAAKAATKATTASKSAAGPEPSSEASTTAESATAAEARPRTRKTILADLEKAALPVVAIELLDSIAGVVWRLEGNNARALGAAVRTDVDVGANDSTIPS
jgi:hypothetical protein